MRTDYVYSRWVRFIICAQLLELVCFSGMLNFTEHDRGLSNGLPQGGQEPDCRSAREVQ